MKLVICVAVLAFALQGNQAVDLTKFKKLISDTFGPATQSITSILMSSTNGDMVKKCTDKTKSSIEETNSCKSFFEEQVKQLAKKSDSLLENYLKTFCSEEAKFKRAAMSISYEDGQEKGIAFYDKADKFQISDKLVTDQEPWFIATDNAVSTIFTIEDSEFANGTFKSSFVSVYKRDPCDGKFRLSFRVDTGGNVYYLTLDLAEQFVIAGDHTSGAVLVGLIEDGKFYQTDSFIPEGQDANSLCPQKVSFHPTKSDILGISYTCWDKVLFCRFNSESGTIEQPCVSADLSKGSQPSEFVFSNKADYLYVVGVSQTVTVFKVAEDSSGEMSFENIQEKATVPESEFKNKKDNAAMVIHPTGQFLYIVNYGFGSVTKYTIDPISGKLSEPVYAPSGGKNLNNIAVSPDGNQVIVSDYYSNLVVVFDVDYDSGNLNKSSPFPELKKPSSIIYPYPYSQP